MGSCHAKQAQALAVRPSHVLRNRALSPATSQMCQVGSSTAMSGGLQENHGPQGSASLNKQGLLSPLQSSTGRDQFTITFCFCWYGEGLNPGPLD